MENLTAIGYMLVAAQKSGLDDESIKLLVSEMIVAFDEFTEWEANNVVDEFLRGEQLGVNEYEIKDDDIVTVTEMGHIVEIQYMERCNSNASILKLNKDEYVNLSDGEIKEYDHIDHRGQSENSLRQTFKRMRYLINNNFFGNKNELFITLTYKENMTCTRRLYLDFDKFMKRLRYRYKNDTTIDYLTCVEPQSRGAWHHHLLLRCNDLYSAYISNSDLSALWGHGFVEAKRLEQVDNIGAYLTAYLTDLQLDYDPLTGNIIEGDYASDDIFKALAFEKRDIVFDDVKCKAQVKGGRIHMYPPGLNIYRHSRGIKAPERKKMSYKDAKRVVKAATPHYSKVYNVVDDDFENVIIHEQYNLRR